MSNLKPGSYYGKLAQAQLAEIGQNATPAMVLTFNLTHIAEGNDWTAIDPVMRDVQFWLTDKAKDYAFADFRALGFNGDMELPKFDQSLYDGTELTVINEQYQGKTQDKVSIAKLKQQREHKPLAADAKRTLAAQFKAAAGMAAKPSTPPPPRVPAADPQPTATASPDDTRRPPF